MTNYRAPWSRTVTIATYAVNALLMGIAIVMVFVGLQDVSRGLQAGWFVMVIPLLILLLIPGLSWYQAPRGYSITDSAVYVRKRARDEEFPFDKIESVEVRDSREVFASAIRVCASGGYYGVFGLFSGGVLSSFRALATNDGPIVILRLKKGEPVVLSPEDPQRFAKELSDRARLPLADNDTPSEPVVTYRPPFTRMEISLELIALALLLVVFAIVSHFWGSLPETIPTHFGFTGEPDAWGPKSTIWILPAVGLGLYLLLTGIVLLAPRIARTPPAPPKARTVVTMVRALLASTKILMLAIFAYAAWKMALTAIGQASGLGAGFIVGVLLMFLIVEPALWIGFGVYVSRGD